MSSHVVDSTIFFKVFILVGADYAYHHCLDILDFVSEGIPSITYEKQTLIF